jgi:hypothetical protein
MAGAGMVGGTPATLPPPTHQVYPIVRAFAANPPNLTAAQRAWIVHLWNAYPKRRPYMRFVFPVTHDYKYALTPIIVYDDDADLRPDHAIDNGQVIGEYCNTIWTTTEDREVFPPSDTQNCMSASPGPGGRAPYVPGPDMF